MAKTNFKSIDEYISIFPKDVQKILEQVRQTIKEIVPDAEETISYLMPTFKLNGTYLIYFAGWKKHIGFFPKAKPIVVFKDELVDYNTSKGAIQFPLGKRIPLGLISRITKFRVKEELEKQRKKS